MRLQTELKSSLITLLDIGNESAVASIITKYPEVIATASGEYPDSHRIADVCIQNKNYRVCRQISDDEKLTLALIDEPSDAPGVPIWLEGEELRRWAKSELENPADEPTDWESFR